MKYIYIIIAIVIVLIIGFKYDANEYVVEKYYYNAEDIKQVNIDLDEAIVEILPSEFQEITIEVLQTNNEIENNSIFIDQNKEQLTIKNQMEEKINLLHSGFKQNKIRIYIPQNINSISFNINGETLKINGSNVQIEQFLISADDLNMIMDGVEIKNMDVTTNLGQFELLKSDIGELNYIADSSNIMFNDTKIDNAVIDLTHRSRYQQYSSRIKVLNVLGNATTINLEINPNHIVFITSDYEQIVNDPFVKTTTGFKYISPEYENKRDDVVNQQYNLHANSINKIEVSKEE